MTRFSRVALVVWMVLTAIRALAGDPSPSAQDLYERLGVSPGATAEQIKLAYRHAALRYHPDRGGRSEDFRRIDEAYKTLIDPHRRRAYDRAATVGRAGGFKSASRPPGPSNPPSPPSWNTGDSRLRDAAMAYARKADVYESTGKRTLLIPWERVAGSYSERSTELPEVERAVARFSVVGDGPRERNVAYVDFNRLLENFSSQIASAPELDAFKAVVNKYRLSRLQDYLENRGSRGLDDAGALVADLSARLKAAHSVSTPEQLRSFVIMNDEARLADAREPHYVTNVQRYFLAFAESPSDHRALAALMQKGVPNDRAIQVDARAWRTQEPAEGPEIAAEGAVNACVWARFRDLFR